MLEQIEELQNIVEDEPKSVEEQKTSVEEGSSGGTEAMAVDWICVEEFLNLSVSSLEI